MADDVSLLLPVDVGVLVNDVVLELVAVDV